MFGGSSFASFANRSSLSALRQAANRQNAAGQQRSQQTQPMQQRTRQVSQTNLRKPPNQWTMHRSNYIMTNRFYVEIGNEIKASFSECSGFGVNIKKETLLEGGLNERQHVLVGHAEFDDVTLKRGMTNDITFWDWLSQTLISYPKTRHNINILLFNQAGETQLSWSLLDAIPVSWKAPAFQAESSSVAIEELTLAYEGIELVSPGGRTKQVDLQSVRNSTQNMGPTQAQLRSAQQTSQPQTPQLSPQVQAQIQALQSQVNALQAQMNTVPSFMQAPLQAQMQVLQAQIQALQNQGR